MVGIEAFLLQLPLNTQSVPQSMTWLISCGRTSLHLNDLGFSFYFSRLVMGLLPALSVEPNEFLLSLYSTCPFHLNLPPILFTRVYSSECCVLNCFVFSQASLNADSGKWLSCQENRQGRSNGAWWIGDFSFLFPTASSAVLGVEKLHVPRGPPRTSTSLSFKGNRLAIRSLHLSQTCYD